VLAVVVAVHAEAGQIEPPQRGDPVRPQIAERDHGVRGIVGYELRRVGGRWLVGEGQKPH
jgi:hypothetical protein